MTTSTSEPVPPETVATADDSGGCATIGMDRLYWARLPDGQQLRRSAQDFRFERLLPLPVDQLHCARTALADGALLIVGIEPDAMRAEFSQRQDLSPACWRLIPDAMPAYLQEAGVDATALQNLNLLHGAFEPAPRRRLRQWRSLVSLVGVLVMVLLIATGAMRRAGQAHDEAEAIRRATTALIDRVVPAHGDVAGVPGPARLTMAVRRLGQANDGNNRLAGITDVGNALDEIWQRWPDNLRLQIDTLTASADRVMLRGRTLALSDAETLSRTLDGSEAGGRWRAQPVQVTQSAQGADFVLTLMTSNANASPTATPAAPPTRRSKAKKAKESPPEPEFAPATTPKQDTP